eukprot:1147835-Pelagomonas_calceolata.AAC.3
MPKLSEIFDHTEQKLEADLVKQLAFKAERGSAAVVFKLRAQEILGHLPDALHLRLLIRAVGEADGGMKWLHALRTQEEYPETSDRFWECFDVEYLPLDPKTGAYQRFFSLRMTAGMTIGTFVDAFRDAPSTLAALGVQAMPDEMLAHYFLLKLPSELRRDVRAQLAVGKLMLASVIAKAMSVGAKSARPPARVNHAKEFHKKPLKGFTCGPSNLPACRDAATQSQKEGDLQAVLSAVEVKSALGDESWMLRRELFEELEQEYGPFDGAACVEGTNAQLPVFCTPEQPFEALDLAGKSVYVNQPFLRIPVFLDDHLPSKKRSPENTGALFILPQWTG